MTECLYQYEFDLVGGSAIHPAWRPYADGTVNEESTRSMVVTLYKEHNGEPITKKDINQLWKSFELDWMAWFLFKPHYGLIFDEYKNISKGNPPFNYIPRQRA